MSPEPERCVEVTFTWRVPVEATDNAWLHEVVAASRSLGITDAVGCQYRLMEPAPDRGEPT